MATTENWFFAAYDFESKEVAGSFANVVVSPSIICLCFSFYFYKYSKEKKYLLWIFASTMVILLSQSRAGYVMAGVAMFVGIYMVARQNKATLIPKFVVISILTGLTFSALIITIPSLNNTFQKSVNRLMDNPVMETVFASGESIDDFREKNLRTLQSAAAIDVIVENPLQGIGFGSFPDYFYDRYKLRATVHNMFLKAWVAVGVSGFLLLCITFISLLYKMVQKYSWYKRNSVDYLSDFYFINILILLLLLFQSQFRGMLGDYYFILMVGLGMCITYQPATLEAKNIKFRGVSKPL